MLRTIPSRETRTHAPLPHMEPGGSEMTSGLPLPVGHSGVCGRRFVNARHMNYVLSE